MSLYSGGMRVAGIGSRQTPPDVLQTMREIGGWLAEQGYLLRSGGAEGADLAFESGYRAAGGTPEIYRPDSIQPWWEACAAYYHPAWDLMAGYPYAKKLHARNTPIILGPLEDLSMKSDCVICWTGNGKELGGTGQGMRIAKALDIPIFNLYYTRAASAFWQFCHDLIPF